jgi:EmrB/QacA subfamily drug resistance transporter
MIEARRKRLVLIATILGSSVVFLDSTVVNLALPKIASSLNAPFSALQWITDGYMLSLSALILLGGSLGDIFGRKKIYIGGLIGFAVSSLLCAVSVSATMLIIARVIQGIFGALVTPGALSIINTNFDRSERSQAIGQWTAWTSIFFIIGPLVGGVILGIASWRWIFLINLPLGALCLFLALPSIRESKDQNPRKVDPIGAILAALALAGFSYGLIEGPARHWPAATILSLVAGLLLSVAFIWFENRTPDPMVKLSLFKSRNFSGANVMTFAMYGALSGFTFALVIYLQTTLHYSSLKAGLSLLPVSILMFLFAGRVGRLSGRLGPRRFMTVGPIIAGLGIAAFYSLSPGDSYLLHVLPGAIIFGIGLVLTVAPLTTTVMTSVDEVNSGIASGINNAVSRAAGLIIIAGLGLLGSSNFYHFSIALCAVLAIGAGLISYLYIMPLAKPSSTVRQ